MKVGCSKNETQDINKILVTPINESGYLGLYNSKSSKTYRTIENKNESIQINKYELRWEPISKDSTLNKVVRVFLFTVIYLSRPFPFP